MGDISRASKKGQIFLANLTDQCSCLTPEFTAFLIQACVVCLSDVGHNDGVMLRVSGDFEAEFGIVWPYNVTNVMLRTWTEQNYTTDHAACAIALLLVHELTELTVICHTSIGRFAKTVH